HGFIFSSATNYGILDAGIFDREKDVIFVSSEVIESEMSSQNQLYKNDPLSSPFYGRPQKHSFAVQLGDQASKIFQAEKGVFVNSAAEKVIAALFGVKSYEDLPSLLSNQVLQQAGAGRHILMQMPSKHACDAMEELLKKLQLNQGADAYHLYNISSKNARKTWTKAGSLAIKQEINKRQWQRTITITVNRLSTGVSIPEWDTVILANSCQSLTRRIQTYGRVETPRVEIIDNEHGKSKYCLKPNCFVIDFNPEQLYEFCIQQEEHTQSLGGLACDRPLAASSVFAFTAWNGEMVMREMTRHDIHQQLDECYTQRDISSLGSKIDVIGDLPINDELRELITVDKTSSKPNVSISTLGEETAKRELKAASSTTFHSGETDDVPSVGAAAKVTDEQKKDDALRREFIYKRILLFTAITEKADNLGQFIELFETESDARAAAIRLGILPRFVAALKPVNKKTLVNDRLGRSMKTVITRSQESVEEYMTVVAGLGALSSNEVLTPVPVAQQITGKLDLDFTHIRLQPDVLDLACKTGSMLLAFHNKAAQLIAEALGKHVISVKEAQELTRKLDKSLYAIPTGPATYEIIKRLYKRMGWKESNILWCEKAPLSWQQNWAYTIAQLTPALIEAGCLDGAAVRKIALNQPGYSILKAEDKTQTVEFLLRLAQTMSEQFDYVISNPPYQIVTDAANNKMDPIYPQFIDAARQMACNIIMVHPARFLSNAGETCKKWNKAIIESPEFSVLNHFYDSKDIFPGTEIKGGIAITSFECGKGDGGYPGGYVSLPLLSSIKKKVWSRASQGTDAHTSARGAFRYSNSVSLISEDRRISPSWLSKYPMLFHESYEPGDLSVLGLLGNKRVVRYTNPANVKANTLIAKYKVLLPKAYGSGKFGEATSNPLVAKPSMICTETFLVFGEFNNAAEADHLLIYIKTRFARTLLSILKTTHNSTRNVWKFVPWQDFTKGSDIDWSKTVSEIDQQLYKKYALTEEEIAFIEDNAQEMK
ncbi:MAG: Eco57I restriction-modification methylase domain-containing protein, partial [Segetibacter sp.]